MTKAMTHYFNRIVAIQCLTVLVLLLPLIGAAYYVGTKHQAAQQLLSDLEPRYARLAGLVEKQADLKAVSDQLTGQLGAMAYPASQDVTQAGNDAQQRIRAVFADNRMEVGSVQVLPQPKEDANKPAAKFDQIRVELRVEGDLAGLQAALAGLSSQLPGIHLENMSVQTVGAVKPASNQRLASQLTFFVLRVRE